MGGQGYVWGPWLDGVPSGTLWTQAVTLYGWEGPRVSGEFMYPPRYPQVRIPSHREPHPL